MSGGPLDWSLLWTACAAGLLVTATHVPLGMQVLQRGIVFIDLAVAQIAGLGVVLANSLGVEAHGWAVQACALGAAMIGALFLTWTEKRWSDVQEAIIGTSFVLAATGALLLLAKNPHGGEHLRELLAGQILWIAPSTLPLVAAVTAVVLLVLAYGGTRASRVAFYLIFSVAVTMSVQLVGLYLVFTTLIVPALGTRHLIRHRMALAAGLSATGYVVGIALSVLWDLPTGPVIVWVLCAAAMAVFAFSSGRERAGRSGVP
jgi:zinc/manganese transport system permease protein